MGMGVKVGVGVSVLVDVGDALGMGRGVDVWVAVAVAVGLSVAMGIGVNVLAGVSTALAGVAKAVRSIPSSCAVWERQAHSRLLVSRHSNTRIAFFIVYLLTHNQNMQRGRWPWLGAHAQVAVGLVARFLQRFYELFHFRDSHQLGLEELVDQFLHLCPRAIDQLAQALAQVSTPGEVVPHPDQRHHDL